MDDCRSAIFQMRFPQKLWYLLNIGSDAILWGGTGRTILLNYRILHNYLQCDNSIFKTTNISSFVRQLNLYGFRKVTSHLQDPICNSSNPYMHEYAHDYFQYGRPDIVTKITRKALTIKKTFKSKSPFCNNENLAYLTPLQKARRALRIALKKAAEEIFVNTSPNKQVDYRFDAEDAVEEICEDENMEFDWMTTNNTKNEQIQPFPTFVPAENTNTVIAEKTVKKPIVQHTIEEKSRIKSEVVTKDNTGDISNPMTITENFSGQFLSMPDLDPDPIERSDRMDLLEEFNIDDDNSVDDIGKKSRDIENISLNCVLPSVGCDQNDYISMVENETSDHYNKEWDQVFNDIMTNKGSSQECTSDFKELYSQISRTIDLLNS